MLQKDRSRFGKLRERVYIVESFQGALVAFQAHGSRQAKQLLKEEWFLEELATKKLYPEDRKLAVRSASPDEASAYEQASKQKETEDLFLAYLK